MADSNVLKEYDCGFIEKCISEMAGGNLDGLQRLYEHTSGVIYGYSLSLLKDVHLSEDIVHDCFLTVYRSSQQYQPRGKPLAWMITITRNLCYEQLRRRSQHIVVEIEDWMFEEHNGGLSAEEKITVQQYLKILSDEEREIVILHSIGGFKHREIAEIVSKSLPAVISKYNRAIKKLKDKLEEGGY